MNKVKNLDKEKAKTLSQKHRKKYTIKGKKKKKQTRTILIPNKVQQKNSRRHQESTAP